MSVSLIFSCFKAFKQVANNRIVDHLEKCDLFHFKYDLFNYGSGTTRAAELDI